MRFKIEVSEVSVFKGLGKISREHSFILNRKGLYIVSFSPDRTAFVRLFVPRTSWFFKEFDVEGEVAFEIRDFEELLSAIRRIVGSWATFRPGASPNTIEVEGLVEFILDERTAGTVKVVPVPSERVRDLLSMNPAPNVQYDAYVVVDKASFSRIIAALYDVAGDHGRIVFTASSPEVGRVAVSASRRATDYTEFEGEAEFSPDKKTAYDVMVSRSAEVIYDQKLLMGVVEAAGYFSDINNKVTFRFGQNKPFFAIIDAMIEDPYGSGKMEVWIAPRGGRL